ncbi:ImmA/IrrE family metallo-endopeptidase [Tistrella sp. BH-R2-4]|uniref:ImmA/IrrE family metallo-endopeptidase n=1 Tax=Tistrella arctica TaxID=3133430 RepID=A0ABU9YQA9_9PROT
MTELACFGDPARFEIAVGWTDDPEPRARRPAHGGWSTGVLRLTVGNHVLTRHDYTGGDLNEVHWYLLPVFEWLATNWVFLLHEERFAWRENDGGPAAIASFRALRRLIDAQSPSERVEYAEAQTWWSRHALRAADSSALFPDVVVRRLIDDIEISWTARQPAYAPDGFRFALAPGVATLPVDDVARPLWEALAWAISSPPAGLDEDDRRSLADLGQKIDQLQAFTSPELERSYLPPSLFERLTTARRQIRLDDQSVRMHGIPVLERIDDAVLMFGGANPDIGAADARRLMTLLAHQRGGRDAAALAELVDTKIGLPVAAPFQEGYDLAEDLLEKLDLPDEAAFVDVRSIVSGLGIHVLDEKLDTPSIRGVAIAGTEYCPAILVNLASPFNAVEVGRRFTLAHELFHVLFDRERAKRVSHTSGPWAPPGVEKRANAFAAMLLMPRDMVRRSLPNGALNSDNIRAAAQTMQVGVRALIAHLYNISMLSEFERDELQASLLAA